jgi:beta-N-acetylhexosaminidase
MKRIISLLLFVFACGASREETKDAAERYGLHLQLEADFIERYREQSVIREQVLQRRAAQITASLPLEKKVGQIIHIGLYGKAASSSIEEVIRRYHPGGIILFAANLGRAPEIKKLNADLQRLSLKHTGIPLLISIDQEGGRVIRVTDGVTDFPGMMALGQSGDLRLAYVTGFITARELRSLGFNFILAPVLDVNNNPDNPVINTRSAGSDPAIVSEIGTAYMLGVIDARSLPAIKHFPGHGDTNTDSHYALPVISRTEAQLNEVELLPFKKAIDAGAPAVMVAHILFEQLDHENPSTLSPAIVNGLLRTKLGFQGLVITDAMEMKAVADRYPMGEAALKALKAGVDITLLTAQSDHIRQIHKRLMQAVTNQEIDIAVIDAAVRRQIYEKLKNGTGTAAWGGENLLYPVEESDSELLREYEELSEKKVTAIEAAIRREFSEHPEHTILFKAVRSLRRDFPGAGPPADLFVFYRSRALKEEALAVGVPPSQVLPIFHLRQLWIRADQSIYRGNWIIELVEGDVVSWNALTYRAGNRTVVGLLPGSPFLPFRITDRAFVLCTFAPQPEGLRAMMRRSIGTVPATTIRLKD